MMQRFDYVRQRRPAGWEKNLRKLLAPRTAVSSLQ